MSIEVREARVSLDYRFNKDGAVKSFGMERQYHVVIDGRRVDSFMTRERAERRAEQLRAQEAAE